MVFVPIKLIDLDCRENLWFSERSASSFYYESMKFISRREFEVLVLQEEAEMNTYIQNIIKHKIYVGNSSYT